MYLSKQQRLEYQERRDQKLMQKKRHRALHNQIIDKAEELLLVEAQLIELLARADLSKMQSLFGFRSLRGYCTEKLRLSRIQSQRLVTIARRQNYARDPNSSILEAHSPPQPFFRSQSQRSDPKDSERNSLDSPDMSHIPIRKWMHFHMSLPTQTDDDHPASQAQVATRESES